MAMGVICNHKGTYDSTLGASTLVPQRPLQTVAAAALAAAAAAAKQLQ